MALIAKKQDKFYDEGGSGQDSPGAAILAAAKEMKDQEKGEGHKTLLSDSVMGPFMVNLQHASDDVDNVRTFIQDEDEMLNVIKSTFPSGCVYNTSNARWIMPWTRTEWMGAFSEQPKFGGAYWGYEKSLVGAKDLVNGKMWVEKVIPTGFQVYRVHVFGSNAGGAGNESKFRSFASVIIGNTNTGAGASGNAQRNVGTQYQGMDSTVLSSGALNGDGVKSIRIEAEFNDKNDALYGGIIELTQI